MTPDWFPVDVGVASRTSSTTYHESPAAWESQLKPVLAAFPNFFISFSLSSTNSLVDCEWCDPMGSPDWFTVDVGVATASVSMSESEEAWPGLSLSESSSLSESDPSFLKI